MIEQLTNQTNISIPKTPQVEWLKILEQVKLLKALHIVLHQLWPLYYLRVMSEKFSLVA